MKNKCLKAVSEEPWAEGFDQGTSRMRNWMENRMSWLSADKVPLEPDWTMIAGAKEVSDLIEWDYYNHDETKKDEEVVLCEVDELPAELQLACFESGVLRLPLDLKLAAIKRDQQLIEEEKTKRKRKCQRKQLLKEPKAKLHEAERVKIRESLKTMSRGEVLGKLVPVASSKQSMKFKPSAKNKCKFKQVAKKLALAYVNEKIQHEKLAKAGFFNIHLIFKSKQHN